MHRKEHQDISFTIGYKNFSLIQRARVFVAGVATAPGMVRARCYCENSNAEAVARIDGVVSVKLGSGCILVLPVIIIL